MKTTAVMMVGLLVLGGLAFAQDDVIAAANAEMDRVEKLIPGVTKGDTGKYTELNDALNALSRTFSKAQRTPALSTANTRSKDLRARVAAAYAGQAAPAPTTGPGAALSTTERGALQRLTSEAGEAQQILDQNPPEKFTAAHTAFVQEKIKRCENELPRCPPASHPDTVAAQAKLDKLKADLAVRTSEAGKLAPGAKKVTASIQAWVPPSSALTPFTPSRPRSSAARALVCSAPQEQYVTMPLFSRLSAADRDGRSARDTLIAPGMWPSA